MSDSKSDIGGQELGVARRFEWIGREFATSHTPARQAILADGLSHGGKRRVRIMGDYQLELHRQNKQYTETTAWHYNEDGTIDGDATGEWTLRNLGANSSGSTPQ